MQHNNTLTGNILKDEKIHKNSCYFSGRTWMDGYLKRNPDVVPRMSSATNKGMSLVTPQALSKWFVDLFQFLQRHNMTEVLEEANAGRIFNLDETFFGTDGTGGKMTKVKMGFGDNVSLNSM
jgi:predicted transcriptional regulator